jgi:biotin transporter BioY
MRLPLLLKTGGYLVSTISVVLLAIVAAPKAAESPFLMACLIGGVVTSIIGMACRWLSYQIEKRRDDI